LPDQRGAVPRGRQGADAAPRRQRVRAAGIPRARRGALRLSTLGRAAAGGALCGFLRGVVLGWGATDRGLAEALAGVGIDIEQAAPDAEDAFLAMLDDLLRAAQEAGTARRDIGVREVKSILVGCQAMEAYNSELAERVTDVVVDGLRAPR